MAYKMPKVLRTTVVGSYPKFSIAEEAIRKYRKGLISYEEFRRMIDEAIKMVVNDYIEAGVDIISDGEQSREDMELYFAERLEGFEIGDWVRIFDNVYYRKPVVVGPIRYRGPMILDDWKTAVACSDGRPVKAIITGPYTLADWAFNNYYRDRRELVLDLAKVVHEELRRMVEAGAEYLQVDEPALSTHNRPEDVELAKEALEVVFKGLPGKKIMHVCFGKIERLFPAVLDYPIDQLDLEMANSQFRLLGVLKEYGFDKELGFGVVDVHTTNVESVEFVKNAIRMALDVVPPEKLYIDPDCGLKRLPRDVALAKLKVMVQAAKEIRRELGEEE